MVISEQQQQDLEAALLYPNPEEVEWSMPYPQRLQMLITEFLKKIEMSLLEITDEDPDFYTLNIAVVELQTLSTGSVSEVLQAGGRRIKDCFRIIRHQIEELLQIKDRDLFLKIREIEAWGEVA